MFSRFEIVSASLVTCLIMHFTGHHSKKQQHDCYEKDPDTVLDEVDTTEWYDYE